MYVSFEDAYEEFKIYASNRHKKQGFETISRNFNNHVLPYFENTYINELTTADILDWQNKIYLKDFSNSFLDNLYSVFSEFYDFCVLSYNISENIVRKVGRFRHKIEKHDYYVYNLSEFLRFRHFLKDNVYKQFFNFMFFYGTRPSEALALKFSSINGSLVNIEHSLQRRGTRELDTPKNQSSIRTIRINNITRFRIMVLHCYYVKKYGVDKDFYVFGGLKPLSTTTIDRYKLKACEKANLRPITQHQFRHSYATRMINKGTAIDIVSRSMGHSKVSTTVDTYLHSDKYKKRVTSTLLIRNNFFETITRNFKKIFQSIITLLV